MSNHFQNWTSGVAIAGRIAERRRPQNWNELMILGDYHLPFGKAESQGKNLEVALAELHHLIEK